MSGGIKGPTTSPTSGLAPASLASAAAPTDRHTRPGVLGAGIRQCTTDRSPEQMQVILYMYISAPFEKYNNFQPSYYIHVHVHVHIIIMQIDVHNWNIEYLSYIEL